MYAIRSYYDKASFEERKELSKKVKKAEKDVAGAEQRIGRLEDKLKELTATMSLPENASNEARITSYNVCYTKLLRMHYP